ncbi:MAG: hypothetical protein AABW50_03285 [Nanoarchaeota archaeon]
MTSPRTPNEIAGIIKNNGKMIFLENKTPLIGVEMKTDLGAELLNISSNDSEAVEGIISRLKQNIYLIDSEDFAVIEIGRNFSQIYHKFTLKERIRTLELKELLGYSLRK